MFSGFRMEFKVFYKNHSQHQWGDQVLEEMTRKNKVMRAKSRHEMRQAFRNMTNESEEENDEPQQLQQDANTKQSENSDNKPVSEEEQYRRRLQRLLQFREQKRRMQQEKKIKTKAPFVPFVPKKLVEVTQEPLAEGTARPKKPLSELLDQAMQTEAFFGEIFIISLYLPLSCLLSRAVGLHPAYAHKATRAAAKAFPHAEKQGIETVHQVLPWLECAQKATGVNGDGKGGVLECPERRLQKRCKCVLNRIAQSKNVPSIFQSSLPRVLGCCCRWLYE